MHGHPFYGQEVDGDVFGEAEGVVVDLCGLYIHTPPASPERLALSVEHVDHDDLVDVDARVRVELGHVRACVSSLSS